MNNIVLDFRHNYERGERLGAQELVYQYDTGRVVEAYVPETESGFVLNVGFESDAVLSVITIDSASADSEGGYKILAAIPDSILTRYGNLLVYIVAGTESTLATTYEGVVPVKQKAVAEDYIEPTEESESIIERAAVEAAAAILSASLAADSALVSEGYAKGSQNGTDVSSGTYYQNNSKYFKEQAESKATAAAGSASAAGAKALVSEGFAVGKQDGTDVSSGSPYYENNAKYYSEEARAAADEIKILVITSSSFSSLPQTINDASITANHVVLNSVLSNPAAQTGDWTVTTSAGSLTVSGTISGSTTLTLYLALKQ